MFQRVPVNYDMTVTRKRPPVNFALMFLFPMHIGLLWGLKAQGLTRSNGIVDLLRGLTGDFIVGITVGSFCTAQRLHGNIIE